MGKAKKNTPLSGAQKVAAFLLSLDKQAAATVLKNIDARVLPKIAEAMTELDPRFGEEAKMRELFQEITRVLVRSPGPRPQDDLEVESMFEEALGRDKARGAPLGRQAELDDPDYATDPKGERIPLDAHIRLARPRTPDTEGSRILRRSYNYSRGLDQADQLDMGLVFVAFQRDLERQFEAVQRRLEGEPLVDYVVPTGGGYFFLPAGARDSQDWVGSGLFL